MKFILFILAGLFLGAHSSWAGNDGAHGGDVIMCPAAYVKPSTPVAKEPATLQSKGSQTSNKPANPNDPWGELTQNSDPWSNFTDSQFPDSWWNDPWGANVKFDYEFYDYFEGRETLSAKIDMGDPKSNYMEKVYFVLDRAEKLDQKFLLNVTQYRDLAKNFLSRVEFISDALIQQTTDKNTIVGPKGINCEKVQFAVQLKNQRPFEKTYYVSKEIWDHADETTRAGLVLHEILYTVEIAKGALNSDGVRYFNSVISSSFMNDMAPDMFEKVIRGSLMGM